MGSVIFVVMGILEFRIRILKDLNPKLQFISNNWNRNENTLSLAIDKFSNYSQFFSLSITFDTAFQMLFLSSRKALCISFSSTNLTASGWRSRLTGPHVEMLNYAHCYQNALSDNDKQWLCIAITYRTVLQFQYF